MVAPTILNVVIHAAFSIQLRKTPIIYTEHEKERRSQAPHFRELQVGKRANHPYDFTA